MDTPEHPIPDPDLERLVRVMEQEVSESGFDLLLADIIWSGNICLKPRKNGSLSEGTSFVGNICLNEQGNITDVDFELIWPLPENHQLVEQIILVKTPTMIQPRPLLVRYFHDDSDDDDFNPDQYDITQVEGFSLHGMKLGETKERRKFYFENTTNSFCMEPGLKYYRAKRVKTDGGEGVEFEEVPIKFPNEIRGRVAVKTATESLV